MPRSPNLPRWGRRSVYVIVVASLLGLAILVFRPRPLIVDAAPVVRGSLQVTIDEEGETRAHDRFVIAAPITGRLLRLDLHDGDPVDADQVLARIAPLPLSEREREEQQARVAGAEALRREADERLRHAQSDYEQAQRESQRSTELLKKRLIATQDAEQARNAEITSRNELEAARFRAKAATSDVQIARAGLLALETNLKNPARLIEVRSPVRGQVLRVLEKSERVVGAGTALLNVGDPQQLEVVIDVLSSDAVKVRPGMTVWLENWGGDRPLKARVRVVEPYAFTKVSALGIEEQRVNIVADFVDPPEALGDGYRVDARIVIWEQAKVLKLPVSAVFRFGQDWAVFAIEGGRAKRRVITLGHRGAFEVEVLAGIAEQTPVITHPSNDLDEGTRVVSKPAPSK